MAVRNGAISYADKKYETDPTPAACNVTPEQGQPPLAPPTFQQYINGQLHRSQSDTETIISMISN